MLESLTTNQLPSELVDGPPMVIWVMGGPGSSKTDKMEDIAAQHPEWRLINASKLVWDFLGQGGNSIELKNGPKRVKLKRILVQSWIKWPEGF